MKPRLNQINSLPDGFLDVKSSNIRSVLPEPTLIQLVGERQPPLFVSVLLHGNEFSGLVALQTILRKYPDRLPRSLYLFVGNVEAAEQNLRVLPNQTDFNRCWPGTLMAQNDEAILMQQVIDRVTEQPLFAAIDVHNNTGTNPHYACMTEVTQSNQQLAAMFNHIGVYFTSPKGVSTMAFNGICPAVTLESGKPGDALGIEHIIEMIDGLLHMEHIPDRPVADHDLQLVHTQVTLNIPEKVSFDFGLSQQADLLFETGFERKNFTEIRPTDIFAYTSVDRPLEITNQNGDNVTDEFLHIENGRVFLKQTMMPAMITLDKSIIRQDCLCYLMVDYQI